MYHPHCWHRNDGGLLAEASGPIHCCSCPAEGNRMYNAVTGGWVEITDYGTAGTCPGYDLRIEWFATLVVSTGAYALLALFLFLAHRMDDAVPWRSIGMGLGRHWASLLDLLAVYFVVTVVVCGHRDLWKLKRRRRLMRSIGASALRFPPS